MKVIPSLKSRAVAFPGTACLMFKQAFLISTLLTQMAGAQVVDEDNAHLDSSATDEGLIFYATFDNGGDAVHALGDARGTPTGDGKERFAPGIHNQGLRVGRGKDLSETYGMRFRGPGNLTPVEGTITFWVKPEDWAGTDPGVNLFVTGSRSGSLFHIYKFQRSNLLFYAEEGEEKARARATNIREWEPNEWKHVAVTWDAEGQGIYVNGKLVQSVPRSQEAADIPWNTLDLGYRGWGAEVGTSILDELKIFNRPLGDGAILREYNRFASAFEQQANQIAIVAGRKSAKVDGVIESGEYPVYATGFFDLGDSFFGRSTHAGRQGHYALGFDEKHLYVGLQTPQVSEPLAKVKEQGGAVWEDDSVEILLSLNGTSGYRAVVNPANTLYTGHFGGEEDASWDLKNHQLASQIQNGLWTVEIAIPWEELGADAGEISQLKLNLARTYRSDAPVTHTSISPVRTGAAYGYLDVANFVKLELRADAPSFALDSIGNISSGKVDLKLDVPAEASTEVEFATEVQTWLKNSYAGKFHFTRDVTPGGLLKLEVKDGKTVLYKANFQGAPASPVTVQYIYTDAEPETLQTVLKNESGVDGGYVHLTLTDKETGKVHERRSNVSGDHLSWTESWNIADLPAGDYDFEAQYYRHDDAPAGEKYVQWYRRPGKTAPWDDNAIGVYEGYVPSPWKPIGTTAKSATLLKQQYTFDHTLLPSGFKANGFDILSRPMSLRINDQELSKGEVTLVEGKPDYALFKTTGEWNGLKVTADIRVEYDGMMWVELNLSGESFKLDRFAIDIPLKPEFATQVHSNIRDTHLAEFGKTGMVPKEGWHKDLYTKPAFWVGNDDAGIAWAAETLEGWRNADRNRAVEVIPGEDESVIRLNVIDRPLVLNGSRSIEFGLQGTPVKDPSPEPRVHRLKEEWGYAFTPSFVYFNYFGPAKEFMAADHVIPLRRDYRERPFADRFFQYIGSNGASPYGPEWGYWGKEWTSPPLGRNRIEGLVPSIKRRNTGVWTYACLNSKSFREFLLYRFEIALRDPEWEINNLYYDLVGPRMCTNAEHGCGWKDDEGNTWPTQQLSGAREFHKRIYQLMKKERPDSLHIYHTTGQPALPHVHAFADAAVEGETFYGNELTEKETYFGIVEPDSFRVTYSGQKWGYPTIFIPQFFRTAHFRRPDRLPLWQMQNPPAEMQQAMRHIIGYLYIHDVSIWRGNEAFFGPEMNRIWDAKRAFFGAWDEDVRCLTYWQKQDEFTVGTAHPERVLATAYVRGNKAMFVVLNDTNAEEPVTLQVNPAKLWGKDGEVKVTPGPEAENASVEGNAWGFNIPPQIFRIYFAELVD